MSSSVATTLRTPYGPMSMRSRSSPGISAGRRTSWGRTTFASTRFICSAIEALVAHHRRTGSGTAVPVRQDAPPGLPAGCDSVSQVPQAPTNRLESGGGDTAHRLHRQPDASSHGHDALCDWSAPGRAVPAQGGRHRQRTHGSMRRFTRLTNAFSKKIENHEAAVALHFMHYNFCRIHKTLRVTPAMEAGLAGHVWSIEELVGLLS
jgi:hypothetical protein